MACVLFKETMTENLPRTPTFVLVNGTTQFDPSDPKKSPVLNRVT